MKKMVALALAASLLGGCTKAATSPSGGASGGGAPPARRHPWTIPHVLRYATAEDIVGLNPHLSQQLTLQYMASLTMAWLTRFDHTNRPIPELATEVPTQQNGGISKDGLTITWHLRRGVRWSDGQPFDADDVVFSTRVVLNRANNEVSRDGWDLITKIDEPDKYTVVYHLKKPYASYAVTFFGTGGANPCILPKHLLANLPNINNAAYNALPVGIGPFKYSSWKRADSVEMVANPNYFRGMPKLQKVIFKIVPDRNTVVTQLRTHELDLWLPATAAFYPRLKEIFGVSILRQPSYLFSHLDLQNRHAPLDDVRVRRALRFAIDRRTINAKLRHGIGIIQDTPISPANPAYDNHVPVTPYDPKRAEALLDEAGWKMGADGVRVKDGKRLRLSFATASGTPDADQQIEMIRSQWKQIGVSIDVRHYPSPLLFAPYANGGIVYGGKWDVVIFAWLGSPIGDLSLLYECDQIPPQGQNDPRYCDPKVDRAMEAFKTQYDERKRQSYADFIQRRFAADAPVIVLWFNEDLFAYNSDLRGFHPNQISEFDDFMNVDI